jgi:hypothetical protein
MQTSSRTSGPPWTPLSALDRGDCAIRERLHAVHVDGDFQSLQSHMAACAKAHGRSGALRARMDALDRLISSRIVSSIGCAALTGMVMGGSLSHFF